MEMVERHEDRLVDIGVKAMFMVGHGSVAEKMGQGVALVEVVRHPS
jgi:hypothetical protein